MLENASPVGFLYRQFTRSIAGLIILGVLALPLTGCGDSEGGGPIVSSLSSPTEGTSSTEGGTESGVDSNAPTLSEDVNPSEDTTENEAEDSELLANIASPDEEETAPDLSFEGEDPEISLTSTPTGVSAQLTWDASTDPDVQGYFIHYGKRSPGEYGSCSYDESQRVGTPPATITDLEPNTPYFFAISAFGESESEAETPCSNEVLIVTPPTQS
jgi:hypothetical protein